MDQPETITPIEIARRYGYSVQFIRHLANQGRLPARIIGMGRRMRFQTEAIDLFFKKAARGDVPAAILVEQFENFWIAQNDKQKSDKSARLAQAREDYMGRLDDNDSR